MRAFDGTESWRQREDDGLQRDLDRFCRALRTRCPACLDGTALGARAAAKARASADPVSVDPGEWTVILEPPAFGELVMFLGSHFSAQSYDEGSSFLSGRLGERVMGTGVTIRDDFAHPLHPDAPFDREGTPKQRLALIENGIARTVVTDSTWARKLDRANTGHGQPAPNAQGPYPLDLVVDPGNASLDDLIAGTKRGLLVTRLWYRRSASSTSARQSSPA